MTTTPMAISNNRGCVFSDLRADPGLASHTISDIKCNDKIGHCEGHFFFYPLPQLAPKYIVIMIMSNK